MDLILERLGEIFSPERITDKVLNQWLPDLVVAAMTFLAFYVLWRLLATGVTLVMRRAEV